MNERVIESYNSVFKKNNIYCIKCQGMKYSIAISLIYAKISSTQQNENLEVFLRNGHVSGVKVSA